MNQTIKLSNILNIIESLSYIADKEDISIKTSYKITKLYKILLQEAEQYRESNMKILNKYGEKDTNDKLKINEDGNIFIITERLSEFNEEMNELNNIEVDIEFDPIKLDDFGNINIPPKYLINLIDKFIIE